MARRRLGLTLLPAALLAGTLLASLPSVSAWACTAHARAYLTGFPADAGSPFYFAREGDGVTGTITVTPGDCSGDTAQATYGTVDGTAKVSQDYVEATGATTFLCRDSHPEYCGANPAAETVPIQTLETPESDPPVRSFSFRLTSATRGLAEPASAPVHIIDRDGPARASLEPSVVGSGAVAYARSESFDRVLIPVFLAGSSESGSVSFTVSPSPQSTATLMHDYTLLTSSPLAVGPSRVGYIEIGLINDSVAETPESVVISLVGANVTAPSTTTLTILDNEENVFPVSRFHHPRQNWKYNKADYRIREFHVFATDQGGSGVVAADLALRRNLASGKCAWKTKSGWQKKACDNKTWLPTKYDDVGELFYYRMNQLKSSIGTKIKDYTAFARAIDGAGNVEKQFTKKRNMNTFEIRRKGKTQKA